MSPIDQFFSRLGVQGFWALITLGPILLATIISVVFTLRGQSRTGWFGSLGLLAVFLVAMEIYVYSGYVFCRQAPCTQGAAACQETVSACTEWLGPGLAIFGIITLFDLIGFTVLRTTVLWLIRNFSRR